MPSFHKLVILFTRYPQAGKCKTRLIPDLGAEEALAIHLELVAHTLERVSTFMSSSTEVGLRVFHQGGTQHQMQTWLGTGTSYHPQQGNNIGERMAAALVWGLKREQDTLLIGSDCPDLDADLLQEGFFALGKGRPVIGPAHDGGYYLLGVPARLSPKICRRLFNDIPWSSDAVFARTMDQATTLGLRPHILRRLHDIDTAEDLKHFHYCTHPE